MVLLKAKNISKRWGNFQLRDISFSIQKNEIVALLGESGSGKSSLLRMLAGLERLDAGEIWLQDKQLAGKQLHIKPQKRPIALSFQDAWLFPTKSIETNIALAMPQLPKAERKVQAQAWLAVLQMESFAERFPQELSGGEQQRIALLRALASSPVLMLMDEPFSKLDQALKGKLRSEMKQLLRKTETAALVVTHDPADVFALADRVLVMQAGEILQQGKPQEVFEQPKNEYIARLMGELNVIEGKALAYLGFPVQDVHVKYGLRPSAIEVGEDQGEGAFQLVAKSFQGDHWRLVFQLKKQQLIVYAKQQLDVNKYYRLSIKMAFPLS